MRTKVRTAVAAVNMQSLHLNQIPSDTRDKVNYQKSQIEVGGRRMLKFNSYLNPETNFHLEADHSVWSPLVGKRQYNSVWESCVASLGTHNVAFRLVCLIFSDWTTPPKFSLWWRHC